MRPETTVVLLQPTSPYLECPKAVTLCWCLMVNKMVSCPHEQQLSRMSLSHKEDQSLQEVVSYFHITNFFD